MKWYKAKLYSPYIEEVEVLRETESCVYLNCQKRINNLCHHKDK